MRTRQLLLLLFIVILLLADYAEARKKRGGIRIKKPKPIKIKKPKPIKIKPIKIKPIKVKPIKVDKKVKRFFAVKHHKKKSSPPPATTSTTPAYITPTMTTFTSMPLIPTPVLLTITDRNFNYYYGYAVTANGAEYYNSPQFLIGGKKRCGCGDSNPIIVTTVTDEIGI